VLDSSGIVPEDPLSLELALWFHDAIYDTRARDNEARSADWPSDALVCLGSIRVDRIVRLILVTQHDEIAADRDKPLLALLTAACVADPRGEDS
jgi:predicted metal-dependent HD superfamily phosphohydrolase